MPNWRHGHATAQAAGNEGLPVKPTTSLRRQVVMAILLGLASLGAAIRYWAPNPSLARDLGTLLLVMWLPAVGNLIAFIIRRFPRRARPAAGFAAGAPFTAHLRVELSTIDEAGFAEWRLHEHCTVVVGTDGFTARLRASTARAQDPPASPGVEAEFLRPEVALPKLPPGTPFLVLAGTTAVGRGRVLAPA
jgi:hypothetical protein